MTRGGGKTWHGGMDIVGVDSAVEDYLVDGTVPQNGLSC